MRNLITGLLFLAFSAFLLTSTTNASAQQPEVTPAETTEKPLTNGFGPGTLDATVSAGLGGLLYPNIEPGIDIGLIPLGGNTSFSVGGTAGLGYCLLCGIVSAFSNDLSVKSWYSTLMARALVHTDIIAKLMDVNNLDFYLGAMAGPNFYMFSISVDNHPSAISTTITTVGIAPVLGLRLTPENSNWLFFAEGRAMLEFGFTDTVLKFDDQTQYVFNAQSYSTSGLNLSAGIGYRF